MMSGAHGLGPAAILSGSPSCTKNTYEASSENQRQNGNSHMKMGEGLADPSLVLYHLNSFAAKFFFVFFREDELEKQSSGRLTLKPWLSASESTDSVFAQQALPLDPSNGSPGAHCLQFTTKYGCHSSALTLPSSFSPSLWCFAHPLPPTTLHHPASNPHAPGLSRYRL